MTDITDNQLVQTVIEAIQEKKGKDIVRVDLSKLELSTTSDFVICSAGSTAQVSAIADSVREYVELNLQLRPYNYDGYSNSTWIVIDYGSVMVHIFIPEARTFYNLEDLWFDAKITEIPNID